MSSLELKTSKFSLALRTRENSDIFNTLGEIYLKKVNTLYKIIMIFLSIRFNMSLDAL